MPPAIVIFGAAILPDGRASPSLARRVGYGLLAARQTPEAPVFCSGGVGRFGPSEASLMADLLVQSGLSPGRIVLDEASADTLQNVTAAVRFIRSEGLSGAIACSDAYHLPRIRMLFGTLGVPAQSGPAPPGPAGAPMGDWLRMSLREVAAYPYDLAVALWRRRELLTLTGSADQG